MDATESFAPYPVCEGCTHEWHGLVCQAPVVTIARLGRRTDPCGCRPGQTTAA